MKQQKIVNERRRYVRLETVFPVEFKLLLKDSDKTLAEIKQGFTRNVSYGGMCLEINEIENMLSDEQLADAKLELFINIPHHKDPIKAIAEIRWRKTTQEANRNKHILGLEYSQIEDPDRKQIIGYAKRLRMRPRMIASSVVLLTAACLALLWQLHDLGIKKTITEKQLLSTGKALEKASEKRAILESKILSSNIKSEELRKNLNESKKRMDLLEGQLKKMTAVGTQLSDELALEKVALEKKLARWNDERLMLVKQLDDLNISKDATRKELEELKNINQAQIVRVRLTNGNYIIGQLLNVTPDRLDVKIGLGSIGIERAMITDIKEVTASEKLDIQKTWQDQEIEAKNEEEKYKKIIQEKKAKGLVYFNGNWIKEEEAKKIESDLKQKEDEVFKLIAKQQSQETAKKSLLDTIAEQEAKPIISVKDKRLYVNGRLFFVKGVSYGIEYPGTNGGMDTFKKVPFAMFEKDFKMIKGAGINTIRTYEPLPEKLLDLAEKCGIMVIENVCYPSDNTDFNSRVHLDILKEQIRKYVLRDKDRKCILMWSIWNDAPWPWGSSGNVVKRYGFERVNNFLNKLYDTVKKYDISHPVTASNALDIEGDHVGWNFLDVIGLNIYLGGYDWFIEKDALRNLSQIKEIEEKYNKPVVILETGFSTFIQGQDQAEILEKQIKIAGTNVAGITIFQWADGWQKAGNKDKQDDNIEEYWGILDGYRNPKSGYEVVAKYFSLIPTESCGYTENKEGT